MTIFSGIFEPARERTKSRQPQELLITHGMEGLVLAKAIAGDVRMDALGRATRYTGLQWLDENRYLVWERADQGWDLLYGELRGGVMRIAEGLEAPTAVDGRIVY